MASCRSAEAVDGTLTSAAGRSSCPAPVTGSAARQGGTVAHARPRTTSTPVDAAPALVFRPTRPLEEAVVLADSEPAAGPLPLSEDGRVTTWCTGTDERFAWRWFEQLASQHVHVVLARLDGCVAVFRTPLPPDPDGPDGEQSAKRRRPCLRCGRSFWSTGPGNRICRFCGIRNAGVIQGFGRAEED